MCTIVKNKRLYKAKKVKQVLVLRKEKEERISSIYNNFTWELGKVETAKLSWFTERGGIFPQSVFCKGKLSVSSGFFHAFPKNKRAFEILQNEVGRPDTKVFLAEIPIGAKWKRGENRTGAFFLDQLPAIITTQLRLVKRVETWEDCNV